MDRLTSTRPLVDDRGVSTQELRVWVNNPARDLLIGTGSPEGVVEAQQGREYMNDVGIAGNIKYIKRDADIGGDTSQGWILI